MSEVNTSVSSEAGISITMDGENHIEHDHETGVEAIPGEGVVQFSSETGGEEGEDGGEQGAIPEDEGVELEPPEDLGEFDPEDAEKWDAQYKGEDGKLNQDALSKEFWANASGETPGSLNEGTYAYLENLGVSREMAKNVEAALVTQKDAAQNKASKRDDALFTLAGKLTGDPANGATALSDALKWGKGGGYTEAQQKRFNAILKGTDEDARVEAVELLMNRHASVSGKAPKPQLPLRDATKGRGTPSGSGLKPFRNQQEAREARKAAGGNQAERQVIAQRIALGYSGK